MATIDLGKIKLKWQGTYAGGTAYVPDDVVYYVDGSVGSSYICVANTTGNAPSSGGTLHASWEYLAKGQATSPTTTQGDIIVRGSSADERLGIGAAGKVLKVNSSANGYEFGEGGGQVLLASADLTGQTLGNITLNYFTNTYSVYKLYIHGMYFSSTNRPRFRYVKNSDSQVQTDSQYSWHSSHPYRTSSGNNHNTHGEWTASYGEMHGQNNVHTHWSLAGEYTFYHPMSTTRKTQCTYYSVGEESDRGQMNQHIGAVWGLQLEAYKGIYIYPAGGTITAISYRLFGIIN